MLERVAAKISKWLKQLTSAKRRSFSASQLNDPPDDVGADKLYLIGEEGKYWLAVLRCPCACGAVIQLPMSANADPCWRFSGAHDNPSLWPSIHRLTGCKSHFFLRRGKIEWCRDLPLGTYERSHGASTLRGNSNLPNRR